MKLEEPSSRREVYLCLAIVITVLVMQMAISTLLGG
jgi:hypothetical protein